MNAEPTNAQAQELPKTSVPRRGISVGPERNKPPIGKEMVSLIPFFFDPHGGLHVAFVLNVDGIKPERFGLIGGMRTADGTETIPKAAQKEGMQEAGLDLLHEDIHTVFGVVKKSRMRDVNDKETGESGYIEQFVCMVPGLRQLLNTSSAEVLYPRWIPFRSILSGEKRIFFVEEAGAHFGYRGIFISHLFVLLEALREMGENFALFAKKELPRKHPFFRLCAEGLAPFVQNDSSGGTYRVLDALCTLDVDGVMRKYFPSFDPPSFRENFTRYDTE